MKHKLQIPPSVNHIYGFTSRGGFARSYITKEGVDWFTSAALNLQKVFKRKTITDPCEIWIEFYHIRRRDVDNILKPLLDVLSKWCIMCQTRVEKRKKGCFCGRNRVVLLDDDQVYKLSVEKHQIKKGEEQYVTIEILGCA